jgi:hypothetical protein
MRQSTLDGAGHRHHFATIATHFFDNAGTTGNTG